MSPELEQYRKTHPLGFKSSPGDSFGWFEVPGPFGKTLFCMSSSDDDLWHHVSVSMKGRCPNWPEMCFVKDLFFDKEDIVVQFHPKQSEYVNLAKHCLHLWKYNGGEMPHPPKYHVL